jgi:hypothetical protein
MSTYLDTTGSPLNNNSGNIRLDNVAISSVPEPASLLLMVGALAALGVALRRKCPR